MRETLRVGRGTGTRKDGTGARLGGRTSWVAALGLALALTAMPGHDARAEMEGPGGKWLGCRSKAYSEEGACFSRADGYWDDFFCGLAFEADMLTCDRGLWLDVLKGGGDTR